MLKIRKKKKKKLLLKIVFAVFAFSCVGSFFDSCQLVHAESNDVSSEIYDDTRYSAVGFGTVGDIFGILTAIADESLEPTEAEKIKEAFGNFASEVAKTYAENAINEANKTWGTSPNYTIQQAFVIMGKRRINYPNGEYEVQTCYLYRDKNVAGSANPQQFGQYTIAPNTLFLVRDTTFNGVIACSFPLGEGNNFQLETYNGDSACDVLFYVPDNDTLVYDTAEGRETIGFRHGANWRSPELHFENNSTNTIVNNTLVDVYNNNGSSYYNNYFPDYYMDNFEALIGTGYWYDGSQGFMTGIQPFYCTTAFFNSPNEFGSSHINDFFTTDPDNINPSKPPAYILPDNNPLSGGQTINNNTINNYNDYGITDIDGQLSIDPDILAGALGGLIDPDFTGALGGVFGAQPEIGLGFDTPLDLNLPDLVGDFLDSITVYPPSSGWEPPSYPAITTYGFDITPVYPTTTVTNPSYLPTATNNLYGIADRLLNSELMPILIGLCLFSIAIGVLW